MSKLLKAKQYLQQYHLAGWLLYDFHHNNPLALEFLDIPKQAHLSRRLFYWIPAQGEPVALVHKIEPYVLDHMPGEKRMYQTWQQLHHLLKELLKDADRVAMEYSPCNALPYISKVDAGTVDMIEQCHVQVVSSGPFLQHFTAELSEEQQCSQREAGGLLDRIAEETFGFLGECKKAQRSVTEYQLQQWVLKRFEEEGLITEYAPTCAFGVHTADPHYSPLSHGCLTLQPDEVILLDFVAKKKQEGSVYGDITRMGFSGHAIPQKYQDVFNLVKKAQEKSFQFIRKKCAEKREVKGYEVDEVCRGVIREGGYEQYFTHRTGHNIDSHVVHGSGTHLDGFETYDDRPLIPNTCFTIEPGIYLPKEWGVRVEYDVLIHSDFKLEITSGTQENIRLL